MFLLAILKTIPVEQEKLLEKDFIIELSKMGINESHSIYKFLLNKTIINIYNSNFKYLKNQSKNEYKIKTSQIQKYVYLTELGQMLLWSLQSDYLREEFNKIGMP